VCASVGNIIFTVRVRVHVQSLAYGFKSEYREGKEDEEGIDRQVGRYLGRYEMIVDDHSCNSLASGSVDDLDAKVCKRAVCTSYKPQGSI